MGREERGVVVEEKVGGVARAGADDQVLCGETQRHSDMKRHVISDVLRGTVT